MTGQPVDLEEAQRLADAATPGPWTVEITGGRDYTGEGWSQIEVQFADQVEPGAGLSLGDHENSERDAEFIAASRSLLPALITELASSRRLLQEAQAERDELRETYGPFVWVENCTEIIDGHPKHARTLCDCESGHACLWCKIESAEAALATAGQQALRDAADDLRRKDSVWHGEPKDGPVSEWLRARAESLAGSTDKPGDNK